MSNTTRQDVTIYYMNLNHYGRAVALCAAHDTPMRRRAGCGYDYPSKSRTVAMPSWFCDACAYDASIAARVELDEAIAAHEADVIAAWNYAAAE